MQAYKRVLCQQGLQIAASCTVQRIPVRWGLDENGRTPPGIEVSGRGRNVGEERPSHPEKHGNIGASEAVALQVEQLDGFRTFVA